MIDHVRRNLVAYLALFVALGGTSYAAASLAPNSVGTAQIKNGAVTGPKLAGGAVTGTKIAPGVLHGLTASVYSNDVAGTPPPPTSQHLVKQATITLPQPGKLLILDSALEHCSVDNSAGATPVFYSLRVYVDGVAVPGTYTTDVLGVPVGQDATCSETAVEPGGMSNVSAGKHTIRLMMETTDTSADEVSLTSGRLIAIATG